MHFCVGRGNLAGCCQAGGSKSLSHCCGSSQQQRETWGGRERYREAEILEENSLRHSWLAYCVHSVAGFFRSEAHTKHSLNKALKSAADTRCGVSVSSSKWISTVTQERKEEQHLRASCEKGCQHVEILQPETKFKDPCLRSKLYTLLLSALKSTVCMFKSRTGLSRN